MLLVCRTRAEPAIPAGSVESSLDGTNAVFKQSSATSNIVDKEGCNTVM